MAFLTDRKRATGLGSARTGTGHHWTMTVSAVALAILVPLFIFTFGPMLGRPHEEVLAYFGRPFPALVAVLTLATGFMHFRHGVRTAIEDYTRGLAREYLIIAMNIISFGAAAVAIFAIARLAL
jgi:succinate dehydrogenase / fumarate reductase membrane anchor subunit